MSLPTAILLGLLTLVSYVAFSRRRDRFYLLLGGISAAILVVAASFARIEFQPRAPDIGAAVLLVVLGVVTAEAFGLPLAIAKRVGFGLRSREWEYDRQLTRLLAPLNDLISGQPSSQVSPEYESWRAQFVSEADRRLSKLHRMRAPDVAWRDLTSAYIEIYKSIVALYDDGASPGLRERVEELSRGADVRRAELRTAYRSHASETLRASRLARAFREEPNSAGRSRDR